MASVVKVATGIVAGLIVGSGLVLSQAGAFAEPSDSGASNSSSGPSDSAPDGGSAPGADVGSPRDDIAGARDAEDTAWRGMEDDNDAAAAELRNELDEQIETAQQAEAALDRITADEKVIDEALRADEAAALEAIAEHRAGEALQAYEADAAQVDPSSPAVTFSKDKLAIKDALVDKDAAVAELGRTTDGNRWATAGMAGLTSQLGSFSSAMADERNQVDKVLQDAAQSQAQDGNVDAMMAEMTNVMADIRTKLAEIQQAERDQMRAIFKG